MTNDARSTPVVMPQMGESLAEGTLVRWLKRVGDRVEQDEPLFEISTDKVDTEVPAPVAGTLEAWLVREGETVAVGAAVATIAAEGTTPPPADTEPAPDAEAPGGHFKAADPPLLVSFRRRGRDAAPRRSSPASEAAPPAGAAAPATDRSDPRRHVFTPAVLEAARLGGLSLGALTAMRGSGRGGRVTKRDVERYLQQAQPAPRPARMSMSPAQTPPEPQAETTPGSPASLPDARLRGRAESAQPAGDVPAEYLYQPGPEDERVAMSPARRKLAHHLSWSARISPHATAFAECDMSACARVLEREKARFLDRAQAPLTYTVLVARAAVLGLGRFRALNASVVGDEIVLKPHVNLGVAVVVPERDDLLVPVVRRADELSLDGLARAVHDVAERARSRRLVPDDVRDGTFTLTNPGMFGGWGGTPILNQPQVAILGLGGVARRPVVVDDAIAIRPTTVLSLTFDHRAVDGSLAFRYLAAVRELLEGQVAGWFR